MAVGQITGVAGTAQGDGAAGRSLLERLAASQKLDEYRQEHWQGSFAEYLDIVRARPAVTRSAYQRMYDMIMSYGTYPVGHPKENLVRYRFFDDPDTDGHDAIFGLTKPLMELVNVLKSAALKYGTERRVILLHGPVGSSKSTIARLLKRGLERYSRTEEGALYTFGWAEDDGSVTWDPMNGEPLQLVPFEHRQAVCDWLNEGRPEGAHHVEIVGEVCPLSRYVFRVR
ncbi:MAG TPA: serine protein kinase, partial [Planctomycetaceae bacterium]